MTLHPHRDTPRPRTTPTSIRRGEATATAKLTEAQVLEMRALAATGEYTRAELARRYHVNKHTVADAVRGSTWAHLPGAVQPRWRPFIPRRGADGRWGKAP
jgi:hypothetical protein